MVSSVPNIGFDKLFLSGWQAQMKAAARDLRTPEPKQSASDAKPSAQVAQGSRVEQKDSSVAQNELTPDQQRQLSEMIATDRKVRAHEQAHLNVGRDLVLSGASYSYETGPDGKSYAVAGEVQIDTSPAKSPEDTIPKAQHIRATALAPADPSPQDHRVAAVANQLEIDARIEVAKQASGHNSLPRVSPAIQAYQSAASGAREAGFVALA